MRLLIVGGHHGLGAALARLAARQGHSVTVFEGDARDEHAVAQAVVGANAVVSTVGPRRGSPPALCTHATANIVAAMQEARVRRLAMVSGALIGHERKRLGLLYRFIRARLPGEMLADRREAEKVVRESGLDWTILRPTRLTGAPPRGVWRADPGARVGALAHIARADAAAAVLEALDTPESIGESWTLQY